MRQALPFRDEMWWVVGFANSRLTSDIGLELWVIRGRNTTNQCRPNFHDCDPADIFRIDVRNESFVTSEEFVHLFNRFGKYRINAPGMRTASDTTPDTGE